MKWETVSDALESLDVMNNSKSAQAKKQRVLENLMKSARDFGDPFAVMRILLPKRDRVRPQYQLKESSLVPCLLQALDLASSSTDGQRLLGWRVSAGSVSGDLSRVAAEVISARYQQRQCERLSLADLHNHLDKLASSSTRDGRAGILRELIKETTANQMKWILRLVLGEMRIGVGEKTVLKAFHPDADDLMSFYVDLHHVCVELASPSARFCHRDVVVGKALKSQHSKLMNSVEAAWDLMKGKCMVAECKFDGDRMQLHKDGDILSFWSRNGLEHPEYKLPLGQLLQHSVTSRKCHQCTFSDVMERPSTTSPKLIKYHGQKHRKEQCRISDGISLALIIAHGGNRCVLDGELLVWDNSEDRFKSRTHYLNRDAARAERKGLDSNDKVCYVVWDILYEEDHGCLLHLPLASRHILLKKFVTQCFPRIVTVLPGDGDSKWSLIPKSQGELSQFFSEIVRRGDEGIVLKDLESQWSPNNRDGRWCKIKPDYMDLGSDLDLLIIGGYYGRGQRGGQVVSYLLAVKDQPEAGDMPLRFLSICRCGVGLSDDEQTELQKKISPHFVINPKSGTVPENSGYSVTNSRYERPDVWISSPAHSMVLQVSAEKRIYESHTFKAGWTFRFPRAQRIRNDKAWHDCLSIQEFQEMVASAKIHGNSLLGKYEALPVTKKTKSRKTRTSSSNMVPAFFQNRDISHVVQKSLYFQDIVFYICKSELNNMALNLATQIKEAGGTSVLNLEVCVTHVISCQPKGMHFRAAVNSGRDVISMDWLQHCLSSKQLLPITPRHYLHMSDGTMERQKDVVDAFGDPYMDAVTPEEIVQVFSKMKVQDGQLLTTTVIQKMESKFAQPWEWAIFRSMCLYMLPPIHSTNIDSQAVAAITLQRLSTEASMRGAEVAATLTNAVTHVIVYAPFTFTPTFTSILRSIKTNDQKHILEQKNVSVLTHSWLHDSLQQQFARPPTAYSLRDEVDATEDHSNSVNSDLCVSSCLPLLKTCGGQESLLGVGPVETVESYLQKNMTIVYPRSKRLKVGFPQVNAATSSVASLLKRQKA